MKKLQIWVPLIIAVAIIVGMFIGSGLRKNIPFERNIFSLGNRSTTQQVFDLIQNNYVDAVDKDSLNEEAILAMLQQLDPHSSYIPPVKLDAVNEDLKGNFQGIGVEFMLIKDTVNIAKVNKDGPSDKAGIKVGDKLIKADDSSLVNLKDTEKIKKYLKGPAGTTVNVTVLRGTETLVLPIKRGNIPVHSVEAAFIIEDSIGFIRINKFTSTTYEEFMYQLEGLQKKGINQLIVDLRDNGGGILMEAVDIADEFLSDDKLIVYTKGNKKPIIEYKGRRPGLFEEQPVVLLINENSASASEVLAGALQDWDRATIVGRRSFGKGLVQEQFELSNGGAVRLTTARYFTPIGRNIQKAYGKDIEYHHELIDRFNRGALTQADTTHFGEPFKTNGGRIVYGGGGITPDVFVAYDTTTYSNHLYNLIINPQFGAFVFKYYIQHYDQLNKYEDAAEFLKEYKEETGLLNQIFEATSANTSLFSNTEKEIVIRRFKLNLASQIWGANGFYHANSSYDPMIQKAISILKEKK